MLNTLRHMTLEELRAAAAATGVEPAPDAVLRALCRDCGIVGWGFVPVTREDALFEQLAHRLGLGPGPRGPQGVTVLERRVYGALFRRAWEASDLRRQRQVLEAALALWDVESLPRPALPPRDEPLAARAVLDGLLGGAAGLRALAAATETAPLSYPVPEATFGGGLAQFAGIAIGPIPGLRARPERGYAALFEVLTGCWRARRRLLAERRAQHQQLRRHLRQISVSMEDRARDLHGLSAPWARQWLRGLAVAAGAAGASTLQLLLQADPWFGWMTMGAGLVWSVVAWASQPRVEADARYARLQREAATARQQLAAVRNTISSLEGE
jgi:hypothetical protein